MFLTKTCKDLISKAEINWELCGLNIDRLLDCRLDSILGQFKNLYKILYTDMSQGYK